MTGKFLLKALLKLDEMQLFRASVWVASRRIESVLPRTA